MHVARVEARRQLHLRRDVPLAGVVLVEVVALLECLRERPDRAVRVVAVDDRALRLAGEVREGEVHVAGRTGEHLLVDAAHDALDVRVDDVEERRLLPLQVVVEVEERRMIGRVDRRDRRAPAQVDVRDEHEARRVRHVRVRRVGHQVVGDVGVHDPLRLERLPERVDVRHPQAVRVGRLPSERHRYGHDSVTERAQDALAGPVRRHHDDVGIRRGHVDTGVVRDFGRPVLGDVAVVHAGHHERRSEHDESGGCRVVGVDDDHVAPDEHSGLLRRLAASDLAADPEGLHVEAASSERAAEHAVRVHHALPCSWASLTLQNGRVSR